MVDELKKLILFIISIAFLTTLIALISLLITSHIVYNISSITSYLDVLFVIIPIVLFIFLDKLTTLEKPQELFADLFAVLILLGLTFSSIFLPFVNESFLRVILALPIIIFLPGYALIAALFPRKEDLDSIERITLSFGLSIVVVPLAGLFLNFTPWGIQLEPLVGSLALLIVFLTVLAGVRRLYLPFLERFTVPWKEIATNTWHTLIPGERFRTERLLSFVLLFSILLAVAATIYVIEVPKEGERFTEFFILGENRTASDYPAQIVVGQNYPLYIGIGNHEYRNMNYMIETWLIRMDFDNVTNTSHLIATDPLDRLAVTLAHNETFIAPYNLSVKNTTYNQVEFLLFNETVPDDKTGFMDRINASYRDLHLWIDIQ
jgi:uncharacterized membrane protein